jgi:hypothetical protein
MIEKTKPFIIGKNMKTSSSIKNKNKFILPVMGGLVAATFLMVVYFAIVSWAESPQHAITFFLEDRWIVGPMIIGFGVQVALYITLKLKLFLPVTNIAKGNNHGVSQASTASVGASGTTSTVAMVACCAHHVSDVLPFLGLTAASTFLAEYRVVFMFTGLGMTFIGIGYMLYVLHREKQKAVILRRIPILSMENE